MLLAKRSPEKLIDGETPVKKLKVTNVDSTYGNQKDKSKSKKRNETILINPELEVKVVPDSSRLPLLNTSSHLAQTFSSPRVILTSPDIMSYTVCGQVPHVTADLCDREINGDVSIVPLHSIFNLVGILKKLGKPLSQFINTPNKLIINPYNSFEACDLTVFNDQLGMSIWGKGGRKRVTSKDYHDIVKTCDPELFVSLSDVVPSTVNKKRANKSCYRTLQWVNEAITFLSDSDHVTSRVLAPIPGSGDRQLTMKSASLLATRDVFGYVIERATLPLVGWEDLVKDVVSILPPTRPVFMLGVLNELEMVKAYNCGCHFVDSTFVLHYANKGRAMLPCCPTSKNTVDETKQTPNSSEHSSNANGKSSVSSTTAAEETSSSDFGPSLAENVPTNPAPVEGENIGKKKKVKEQGKSYIFKPEHYIPNPSRSLDLISPEYTRQFTPLVEGCGCFTCARHTRGYLSHLLVTHELLAPTLLMLHNLAHVRNVVQETRRSVEAGELGQHEERLRRVFEGQSGDNGMENDKQQSESKSM